MTYRKATDIQIKTAMSGNLYLMTILLGDRDNSRLFMEKAGSLGGGYYVLKTVIQRGPDLCSGSNRAVRPSGRPRSVRVQFPARWAALGRIFALNKGSGYETGIREEGLPDWEFLL